MIGEDIEESFKIDEYDTSQVPQISVGPRKGEAALSRRRRDISMWFMTKW